MNMMLLAIFASVGVGMFVSKFERREILVCAGIAAILTLIYLFRPATMT